MSELPEFLENTPIPAGEPMPWYQVWITALTKPNERTFAELAAQPGADAKKAYLWVFLTSLVTMFLMAIVQSTVMMPRLARQFSQYGGDFGGSMGGSLIGMLCAAPFAAGFAVLVFMVVVGIIQWIAKLFGGTGSYDKLAYTFSAIMSPAALVSTGFTLLSVIPVVGFCFSLFSMAFGVYVLVLEVMAVKAVNDLDWGKAAGAVLLPGLLIFLFFCCLFVILGVALGPTIGNVFSQISSGLY
ncbi:MAG: hypothetical protein GXP40_11605 [Chloroflexi bacterium]|nr:hypothetical protein [Chloroflexota bacterium]